MKVYRTITLKDGTKFDVVHEEPHYTDYSTTSNDKGARLAAIAYLLPLVLVLLDYIFGR